MKKEYNIKISKYFEKSFDNVCIDITISKEMSDLIKNFACTDDDDRRTTSWTSKPIKENSDDEQKYIKRYLVKTVLKNSIPWTTIFDLLFTESIIDTQKIKVPLTSIHVFTDIQNTINQIKELVTVMEKILTNKDINVTLKVQ